MADPPPPVIRTRALGRSFAGGQTVTTALAEVDLVVAAGRLLVIRGASGCGKSTLLKLIGLMDRPSTGDVLIDGVATAGLDERARTRMRRRSVGYLFQDAGLIGRMSAADNIALPLVYSGLPAPGRAATIEAMLDRMGLGGRGQQGVDGLSGGERQRVSLARALINDPPCLVCDEPTASLDRASGETVINLLADRVAAGIAVVCSTHDPALWERADSRVTMAFGRIVDRDDGGRS